MPLILIFPTDAGRVTRAPFPSPFNYFSPFLKKIVKLILFPVKSDCVHFLIFKTGQIHFPLYPPASYSPPPARRNEIIRRTKSAVILISSPLAPFFPVSRRQILKEKLPLLTPVPVNCRTVFMTTIIEFIILFSETDQREAEGICFPIGQEPDSECKRDGTFLP